MRRSVPSCIETWAAGSENDADKETRLWSWPRDVPSAMRTKINTNTPQLWGKRVANVGCTQSCRSSSHTHPSPPSCCQSQQTGPFNVLPRTRGSWRQSNSNPTCPRAAPGSIRYFRRESLFAPQGRTRDSRLQWLLEVAIPASQPRVSRLPLPSNDLRITMTTRHCVRDKMV